MIEFLKKEVMDLKSLLSEYGMAILVSIAGIISIAIVLLSISAMSDVVSVFMDRMLSLN